MQRRIQVAGWALIWSGIFVLGYLGWQLYGTDLVNARVQDEAQDELVVRLETNRQDPPEVVEVKPEDGSPDDPPIEYHTEDLPVAEEGFAFIRVPSLDLRVVIFEGVDRPTLQKGPGHMPGTPLPGQPGNSVISGHRTTYGRPFHDFDRLEPGDVIEVETAIGTHVYEVRELLIVAPTDVWVTDEKEGGWLTLTTCNPKYSARERLIVSAELISGPNLAYIDYLTRI
jgi:sortase A